MKVRPRRTALVLVLLTALLAYGAQADSENLDAFRSLGDTTQLAPLRGAAEREALGTGKAGPIGTKDAPVDGKDGMPHEGPFVETNAERERKKMKDSGDEEPALAISKVGTQHSDTDLPVSNDGVMDDDSRRGPAEGTRGTEGGVSEKWKDTKLADKLPDPPKEPPPLPHSEKEKVAEKMKAEVQDIVDETDDKKTLAKPSDLPAKPHDIPHPENPSSPKDTTITPSESYRVSKSAQPEDESGVIQPLHSLFLAFTMIIFSEIGDKTFLVAALMAMRHDRWVVFTAAFSALITMTVLSAFLGHAVPTLIPKTLTNFLAAGLFLVFGVKMMFEARNMSADEGVGEEMKEVEMELEEKEHQQRRMNRRSSITPYELESGRARETRDSRLPSPPSSAGSSRDGSPSRRSSLSNMLTGINNLCSLLLSPAWVQTFVMTFLGEWGDRSQIATIAMAAGQDYWYVIIGALVGHGMCTAGAVIGGKAIAGRISVRTVTMGGAIAFLVFGFIYLIEAIYQLA